MLLEVLSHVDEVTDPKLNDIYSNVVREAGLDADSFKDEMGRAKGEPHQHLCLSATGEANANVRDVRANDGSMAWNKLLSRFARRTSLRRPQSMMTIMMPPKANYGRSSAKALESCELHVNEFNSHFNDNISITSGLQSSLAWRLRRSRTSSANSGSENGRPTCWTRSGRASLTILWLWWQSCSWRLPVW